MTEKTFTAATMKVKLASEQTLSAKLTADARMTAKMDLMYKGDKGDKGDTGDTGETIASAYCNPDGTMVLTMDSGRRVATNLQPLTDSMGYAESAKESAAAAAASQSSAAGSGSAAASSASASAASASAAKTSETTAKASETKAAGSESAAASSASAAASSASAASSSQSAAKTSETNAKTSETNAAASASAAAASARTQQSDWGVTDNTLQSYIKNKPTNLLTTNTTQTITGDKEFTGAVTMATGKITTATATTVNADTVNATYLSVTGSTSVPTANADNNSNTVANTAFVKTAIANIVNGAPSQLDTLQELSAALGNDANFSATVAKEIGEKVSKSGDTITGPILYDKTPNDDTELPNKAYVDAAIKSAVAAVTKTLSDNMYAQYPVGSYIYSDKADNPATYLPYMSDTTWVQTAAGRVLIGAGTADSGTVYAAGATGGEEKHQLTVEELPTFTPSFVGGGSALVYNGTIADTTSGFAEGDLWGGFNKTRGVGFNSIGGNQYHNNLQPYMAVYVWHRTA